MRLTAHFDSDVAFQHDNVFRRTRRLVAFDMDSTLIQAEVIDQLARLAGVGVDSQFPAGCGNCRPYHGTCAS